MESSNILVVEDNAAHAELISLAFEPDAEFRLQVTPCLRAARAAIAERPPELVITDLLLPDGRGIELLSSDGRSPKFPVVVMTSYGDEQVAVEAMRAGAVNYVVKSEQALADLPRIAMTTLREWGDVVERRKADAALLVSERRYRTLFEDNPSTCFTVDARGIVVSANRFAAEQLGREAEEMVGHPFAEIHVQLEQRAVARHLGDCFREPVTLHRWDTCHVRRDGTLIWANVTARVIASPDAGPVALLVCEDVTAAQLSDDLSYQASDDPLTGLANQRKLERRHDERQWVPRIHRALEEDRFRLVAQPIVSIGDRDGAHFELLVRMVGEDGEEILPSAFLALAERYGLMQRIDRWVMTSAFDWLSHRRSNLDRLAFCSINLSGCSVSDPTLHDFIVRKLQKTGLSPEKICFEITETIAIANLSMATKLITKLRTLGCRVALDDFGSGSSSFDYLKNLPVDFIKIDGMFVRDIADDPMDLALVKAIVDTGHVMGKETIAECVEDERVLKTLAEVGIDYVQGLFVGAPRSLEMLAADLWKGDREAQQLAQTPLALAPVADEATTGEVGQPFAHPRHRQGVGRSSTSGARRLSPVAYRILHVDDDPVIRVVTEGGLRRAGFEVWSAESGQQALNLIAERGLPHLALVDIFLSGMSGRDLCNRIQASVDLPIIMVTSVDDSETEEETLREVAEDYVTKPFDVRVLVARVERLLRRIGDFAYALGPRIRVDDRLEVELGRRRVHVDGRPMQLTQTENKLLYILIRNAGQTVTSDFLLRRVWPREEIYENVLRTHIARLRKKIELQPGRPRYVMTRRGLGYFFKARD